MKELVAVERWEQRRAEVVEAADFMFVDVLFGRKLVAKFDEIALSRTGEFFILDLVYHYLRFNQVGWVVDTQPFVGMCIA